MGCATVFGGLLSCGVWFIAYYLARRSSEARARALCGSNCACPMTAIAYVGWNGTVHTFELASRPFALQLMLANRSRLVNVDFNVLHELEQLAVRSASPKAPTASIPLLQAPPTSIADPDERIFLDAIEKLESQKGSASRRAHVDATMARLSSPSFREKFAIEASRIEVQSVLDKVDSLKTASAKKRHLTAALETIRSDSIPDALQSKEIAWLEEALADIERRSRKSD